MWSKFQALTKHVSSMNMSMNRSSFHRFQSMIAITGSSYLFPTLRLSRFDSPEKISSKIDAELSRNIAAESMLNLGNAWAVPIVLDLAAFAPDGSPHYSPPSVEMLKGFVQALDNRGMKVIGLANIANCGGLAEDAAASLGIPAVFGVRMISSASSFDLQEIFQIISSKVPLSNKNSSFYSTDADSLSIESEEVDLTSSCSTGSAFDVALHNLTYRELQQVCKHSNLPAKGKAVELIDRSRSQFDVDPASVNLPSEPSSNTSTSTHCSDESVPDFIKATYIHKGNIRSGQQVSAEGKSLVVMGNVNPGGEVMADGDIYIFGKLQGRALAGLQASLIFDNSNPCKIFVKYFDPELVGIGKVFTTVTNISDIGLTNEKNVIVSLRSDDGSDTSSLSVVNA